MLEGLDDVLSRIDTIQKQIKRLSGYDERFANALKEKSGDEQTKTPAGDKAALEMLSQGTGSFDEDPLTGSPGFDAANAIRDAALKNKGGKDTSARMASDLTSQAMRMRPSAYGDTAFDQYIRQASQQHGLPFALIKAVVHQESQFNPNAVSHAGAQGLMQIMPQTGQLLGLSNPFNPRENIMAGSAYLKEMMKRYNGNVALALAAYNAGPGAVDAAGGVPNYSETKGYVQKVLEYYGKYS